MDRFPRGRFLIATGALLVVAGCAGIPNEEAFKYEVSKWQGRDASDLVKAWGPPAATVREPNGNTVYTYNKGEPISSTCVVKFTLDPAQKVVGWKYSGTTCRSTY
jgi:hypothetical protein